jgi:hypothetical protein
MSKSIVLCLVVLAVVLLLPACQKDHGNASSLPMLGFPDQSTTIGREECLPYDGEGDSIWLNKFQRGAQTCHLMICEPPHTHQCFYGCPAELVPSCPR